MRWLTNNIKLVEQSPNENYVAVGILDLTVYEISPWSVQSRLEFITES